MQHLPPALGLLPDGEQDPFKTWMSQPTPEDAQSNHYFYFSYFIRHLQHLFHCILSCSSCCLVLGVRRRILYIERLKNANLTIYISSSSLATFNWDLILSIWLILIFNEYFLHMLWIIFQEGNWIWLELLQGVFTPYFVLSLGQGCSACWSEANWSILKLKPATLTSKLQLSNEIKCKHLTFRLFPFP